MAAAQELASFLSQHPDFERYRADIYSPLDINQHEFRLMTIHPGDSDDEIRITLEKTSLDSNPRYEAVSYTWEDLTQTRTVELHGHEYIITKNQYEAVRHFRQKDTPRVLWMDVFCIDQANLDEKGYQVSEMGKIYAGATTTVIWLGQFNDDWIGIVSSTQLDKADELLNNDSDLLRMYGDKDRPTESAHLAEFNEIANGEDGPVCAALYVLKMLAHDHHLLAMPLYSVDDKGKACPNPNWYKAVDTLNRILSRPWWQRAWVLQEVAWSKQPPIVHMGSFQCPLDNFYRGATGMVKHVIARGACCMAKFQTWCLRDINTDGQTLITKFPFLYNFIVARDLVTTGKASFESAVSLSANLKVTDPRDCIYSLLSLVPEDQRIHVDYNYTIAQTFTLASWTAIQHTNSLNQLYKVGTKQEPNTLDLPSWVRNWSIFPKYLPYRNWIHNLTTYAVQPDWNRTAFDPQTGMLTVPYLQLDTVKICFPNPTSQNQPFHVLTNIWHQQLKKSNYTIDLATLVRTIFRNTSINKSCKFHPGDVEYLMSLHEQLSHPEIYPDPIPTGFTGWELHTEFRQSTRWSCLFVTAQGRLGIGHEGIQAGDLLCHVRGCCLPVAVRWSGSSGVRGVGQAAGRCYAAFKVIDACYLDGCMELEDVEDDWDAMGELRLV